MSSLIFHTQPTLHWTQEIMEGLRGECENLTGITANFPVHTIYVTQDSIFMGGVILEQHGDILWLDALWVHPERRKQGTGRELMKQALHIAGREKAREIQLNTYFDRAHTFFRSCGYEDVTKVPQWKYGLTCYLMRRDV